jgi:hypothetical protein
MKITNRYNLPKPLVDAVTYDGHRKGDYSVTEILNDPCYIWLNRRHSDEIEEDVTDRFWAMCGTAIHEVLAKNEDKDSLQEEYLKLEIEQPTGNKTLTGSADIYKGGTISDYKFTSVWSIIYKSMFEKWEQQLNCYAYMYRKNGFEVKELQVVALLKDWSKAKASNDANYPQCQVAVVDLPLWDEKDQKEFIEQRIRIIESHKDVPDNEIPACFPQNRWQTETKYAVMKEGRKSAVKLFTDESEAKEYLDKLDNKHYIDIRKGVDKRCMDYCSCNKFCDYYRKEYLPS